MPTRARVARAIGSLLSTVALSPIAATGVVGGLAGLPAQAQQTTRSQAAPVAQETGQFSSSGTIIWLRVDEDGSVLVFAARGFRSAFAHPSVLTAAETDAWAAAIETFLRTDSAAARAGSESGGRSAAGDGAGVHRAFADGDVTLDQRLLGQTNGLVLRVGVNGAAPVNATFATLALPSVLPVLRATAQLAKRNAAAHQEQLAAAAATPAAATPAPAATPVSLSVQTRVPATALAATGAGKAAPPRPRDSASAAGPAPKTVLTTTPVKLPIGDSSPNASAQIGHVVEPPGSHIEYTAALTAHKTGATAVGGDSSAAHAGTPVGKTPVGGTPVGGTPVHESGAAPAGPAKTDASAGDSIAEKALSSEGRLPPSVLGDIVRQRQQLLQYCYTEFGLRADAALAGQIVVRMVIQQDGTVSEVTVPHHSWTGHGADHVESCIRDRVLHWQFPAAQRASTHEIQLIFGR